MTDDADVWEVARRLYAVPRSAFIATRNDEAGSLKQAGELDAARQVKGFAKPSAAADLVNRLVRGDHDLVEEIRELGTRLRAAQRGSEAGDLRALDRERRALVNRSVDAARGIASADGERATEATLRDVEQTVWAAIVDAGASATVRAAVLVSSLSPSGFGSVDVAGASALPVDADAGDETPPSDPPPRRRTRPASAGESTDRKPTAAQHRRRREAEAELEAASTELSAAEDVAKDAERRLAEAEEQAAAMERERAELRERLATLDREGRAAAADTKERKAAVRTADRQRRTANGAVERARRRLADLDDGS